MISKFLRFRGQNLGAKLCTKVPTLLKNVVTIIFQIGDSVIFADNGQISEGQFISSGIHESFKNPAKSILSKLLNDENDIRTFCANNNIGETSEHVFGLVIDAFLFLSKKFEPKIRKRSCGNDPMEIPQKRICAEIVESNNPRIIHENNDVKVEVYQERV